MPPGLETAPATPEPAPDAETQGKRRFPLELHGFWDTRGGLRPRDDPAQSRSSPMAESRLQLKTQKEWDRAIFEFTGDFIVDGVMEEIDGDLRQARLTWTVSDSIDLRIGRQVLTWGTGDLLFINDLFPKDWNAFFIGRDVEYLKAPSDAVKVGWYHPAVNVEFVYTPQFAHDRFITGDRISFWNPLFDRHDGASREVDYNAPSTWFQDDEFALRLYRRVGKFEVAAYGYSGYWKSPGGQRLVPFMQASFPKLRVYGASARGPVGKGIVNVEAGYYDSRQDESGDNPFINNSEFRFLVGYEREIGKDFTAAFQYYLERMMDYGAYMNARIPLIEARDRDRHLFTVRLTKLLMNQNLTLSWFGYYSPTDGDAYFRPNAQYKINDHWMVEGGANVFLGESDASFFGQFKYNTNVYAAARFSF
ncbi:MAG TPA: hypothetical protein PKL84_11395 [Candidatus Hydrogenedentes bacterium]|nr:hypothetical protein [Candidatus Hydrogenedentota bacterium]